MDLYTASFALESLEERSHALRLERRLEHLELALMRAGEDSVRPLVATPAGFLRVADNEQRDRVAERLLRVSLRHRVALIAGVDVLADDEVTPWGPQPESYLLAADRGRPLAWPFGRHDAGPRTPPVVMVDEQLVGLVVSQDLFDAGAKREMQRLTPSLVILPTHTAVTDRWEPALGKWSRVAPLLVAEPLWLLPQRRRKPLLDFEARLICQTANFTMHRHVRRPPEDNHQQMFSTL